MKKLSEVMTTSVDVCSPQDNVYEAALKMKKDNVGVIPVCDNGQLLGVITDRDLAVRCIAEKRPGSTKVSDVMTTELVTAGPEMSVQEAAELMSQRQIRRLPIVEGNKLAGIISIGDLSLDHKTDMAAGHALSEISETRDQIH
ncbi:CBS domain-containing protein [Fictibacillus aquaticus]|uniref:CBS domain-containing protein n=1 Tax=Fictibacillus aquaticus TaxID=2021314 RepID=A0A235FCD3_9BACL|nr:CBS domain-containing protein [Fictibacillus aquaticus]OYD58976.1 CBS domain-containing protein [Fictibacillus aquaticus]